MESYKPQGEKKDDVTVNNQEYFLSQDRIKNILTNSMLVSGTIFAASGIYEFLTGEKVSHLFEGLHDQIPKAVNSAIAYWDGIPTLRKTGSGASLTGTGLLLKEYFGAILTNSKRNQS